jgi:hypothetical protein
MVAHNFVGHLLSGPWKNLLLQSFLFYFSWPAQEVLPLTNLLSPQEKSLSSIRQGQIYFGHFEASSLISTYVFALLHILKSKGSSD